MSSKKEAAESLTKLKNYLARDKHAISLIGQVERFIGDLRRERSELRSEADLASRECKSSKDAKAAADIDVARLREEVQALQANYRQAELQVAAIQSEADQLRNRYESDELEPQCDLPTDTKEMFRIAKRLMRDMPKVPPGRSCPDIRDIMRGSTDADYTRLGLFVAFCCLWQGRITISGEKQKRTDDKSGCAGRDFGRFIRWISPWIKDSEIEKRITRSTILGERDKQIQDVSASAFRHGMGFGVSRKSI